VSPRKPTIAKHLPCPQCEYDLFGLIEEYGNVRCPECGEDVDVDLAIKQVRVRKVRITFLWLVGCVGAFLPVAVAAGVCLTAPRIWCVAVLAVSAIVWLVVLEFYRQRHRKVDYAGWALLLFHGCFILASMGGLWILYVALYLAPQDLTSTFFKTLALFLLSLPAFAAAWWLYWWACGLIEDGHDLLLHRTLGRPL